MKNSKLEALIFDVDGTLSDTERDGHRVAFNAAFDEYGINWHWDEATYGELLAVTGGKERMHYFYDSFPASKDIDPEQAARLDELIPELHKAKTRHYMTLLATGAIPLRPGVERLLREAREQGLRLAIATTTTPENVTSLLEHTLGAESIDWFEVIAAGDIVPAKKPSPDIYDYALEKLHLTPAQCLAFEDSHNGILSSMGASLTTIITTNGYTRDHDFSGAAIVLDQLGEPDSPMQVLAGDARGHAYVDCALLKILHAEHSQADTTAA
jgi:HAD superfamily hydrolase (TIGR01509 family)